MSVALKSADRRGFLGALAATSVTALATGPALADGNGDAELLELGRQWQASRDEMARLADRLYAAEDRVVVPPYPEEIYFRRSDLRLWQYSGEAELVDGLPIGRKFYRTETSRGYIRLHMENAQSLERGDYDRAIIARATEIFDAFDRWTREREANSERAGVPVAIAELERATKAGTEIRRRIVLTPARAIDGLLVKAALAHWCRADDDETMDAIFDAALEDDEFICHDAAQMSLLRDVLALADSREGSTT